MNESDDPLPEFLINLEQPDFFSLFLSSVIICLLLILSALVSGSEVAFFSFSPTEINGIKSSKTKTGFVILDLLDKPKRLLATILITNNFVNVGIIILSSYIASELIDATLSPMLLFFTQVVVVTLLILIVGEVTPKVYATKYPVKVAIFMAYPLLALRSFLKPFSSLLIFSTSLIDKKIHASTSTATSDHLSYAIDLTTEKDTTEEEKKILKGIVKFGNTDVKQIMKSRVDVDAIDIETSYTDLLKKILDSGYSRIPVYKETFDKVEGILYIKDLLKHLDEAKEFKWQNLLRQPFFVPENKKINDLLEEFQAKKIHLAIVVDEFGGTSGIVTLEDIIEEIVGDITDEFDEEDVIYSRLDERNIVFEGKTLLNDVYRALDIDGSIFENAKGDSDTLAGFILELSGKIPKKNEKITFDTYTFTVEAADKRRIKQVKVTINDDSDSESNVRENED